MKIKFPATTGNELFVRRELLSAPQFLFITHVLRPLSKIAARLPLLKKLQIA